MVDRTPFDPPDPDANLPPADSAGTLLDPRERVRQAFQQLRIDDRRLDSPMNWMSQGPVIPTGLHPLESPYYMPDIPGRGNYHPVDYKDVFNPLSVALGVKDIDTATDKKIAENRAAREAGASTIDDMNKRMDEIARKINEERDYNKQMQEYNKRLEERRKGRKEAGAK